MQVEQSRWTRSEGWSAAPEPAYAAAHADRQEDNGESKQNPPLHQLSPLAVEGEAWPSAPIAPATVGNIAATTAALPASDK